MSKVAGDKSETVRKIPAACADEAAAVAFFEEARGWDQSPACPKCGDTDVYQMQDRKTGERQKDFRWRCRGCKQQYTVRTGTVYEDSRIPLRHWCYAFWKACSSKKGISALQIKRETGLSYKSALFLMHRIRFAMAEEPTGPLTGTIEADETYVGGKPRGKVGPRPGRRGPRADLRDRKVPVVALLERGPQGRVRARVPEKIGAANLTRVLTENVDPNARLITDESILYRKIGRTFRGGHERVNHHIGEYARGDITTNGVEGFFALLKRGVMGTFHHVSRTHLHRYVSEFEFRYNHRKIEDGARTVRAIRGAEGKRLCYRVPPGSKR